VGAGVGREAGRTLWPLVLQLWSVHPLVLTMILVVVGLAAMYFLGELWDIIRPIPWQPHEPYRPPAPQDADRSDTAGPRQGTGR
jgi:hypothetical protein